MNINYTEGTEKDFPKIENLWYKIRKHHSEKSTYFKESMSKIEFTDRMNTIIKKANGGKIKIIFAENSINGEFIGYCISSINDKNVGEIESLFIDENFRNKQIATNLMKKTLSWFDKYNVKGKKLYVVTGNEEVLEFYKKFNFYPKLTELNFKN